MRFFLLLLWMGLAGAVFSQTVTLSVEDPASKSMPVVPPDRVVITIGDLTFESYQLDQYTGESLKIFSIVLVTYFALSLCVSIAFRFAERFANVRFGRPASA